MKNLLFADFGISVFRGNYKYTWYVVLSRLYYNHRSTWYKPPYNNIVIEDSPNFNCKIDLQLAFPYPVDLEKVISGSVLEIDVDGEVFTGRFFYWSYQNDIRVAEYIVTFPSRKSGRVTLHTLTDSTGFVRWRNPDL